MKNALLIKKEAKKEIKNSLDEFFDIIFNAADPSNLTVYDIDIKSDKLIIQILDLKHKMMEYYDIHDIN